MLVGDRIILCQESMPLPVGKDKGGEHPGASGPAKLILAFKETWPRTSLIWDREEEKRHLQPTERMDARERIAYLITQQVWEIKPSRRILATRRQRVRRSILDLSRIGWLRQKLGKEAKSETGF